MCLILQTASLGLFMRWRPSSNKSAKPLEPRLGTGIVPLLLKPFNQNKSHGQTQIQKLRKYSSPFDGRSWRVTFPRARIQGEENSGWFCLFLCCCFFSNQSKAGSINDICVLLPHHLYYFFNLKNYFWEALKISSLWWLGIFIFPSFDSLPVLGLPS